MARVGWKAVSCRLARLLSFHAWCPEGARQKMPRILAIVPQGPNWRLLQAISRDTGWALTVSETPPNLTSGYQADVPPIVIYDRDLSPNHWREIVGVFTKKSPRPYVILLSPNADANLWDELQRVGGSDILRTPVNQGNMLWAVKRAWVLWRIQQHIRLPVSDRL
jgi:DNA-binding NtrC family response regulator